MNDKAMTAVSRVADALHMGSNGADRIREWEQGKREITGPASVAIRLMLERVR